MEAIKPQDLHNEIGKTQSTSWFVVNQEMINTFADVTFVRRRPRPPQLSQGSPSQDRPPGPFSLPSQNELFGGAAIAQEGRQVSNQLCGVQGHPWASSMS